MNLIVGLGNPGNKYVHTRHNIGFRAIFSLANAYNIDTTLFKKKAIIGKGLIGNNKVILAQPLTYMNNSGEAVKLLVDYFKIPIEKIIVISDDLDLSLGKIRIKQQGSAGGHNGLKSIINYLGTKKIARIRIGIDRPPQGVDTIKYVLGYFAPDEEKLIEFSLKESVVAIEIILKEGFQVAMNKFN